VVLRVVAKGAIQAKHVLIFKYTVNNQKFSDEPHILSDSQDLQISSLKVKCEKIYHLSLVIRD